MKSLSTYRAQQVPRQQLSALQPKDNDIAWETSGSGHEPGAGERVIVRRDERSGFQDRDETVYGHKPFLVLADYLTRRGIAVLTREHSQSDQRRE